LSKKLLHRQCSKKRKTGSESVKWVKELDANKKEMMLKMFYSVVRRCLKIDYKLVAGWFTCESLIKVIIGEGIHLIGGMYKIIKRSFYTEENCCVYSEMNNQISNLKRCRSLGFHYKRVEVMLDDIRLTLFFSRKGKGGNRKVFFTTDTAVSYVKLIEHYRVRWTVEVFDKEAKGLQNLGGC